MIWVKVIIIVSTVIIAIGGLYLTKPNRPKLAFFLSSLIIISAISGIVVEVRDAKSKKQQQDKVVAQNTELLGKIEILNDQNKELIAGTDKLVELNTKLSGEIGTYQQDLREKEDQIKELDKKAKMSARGITSIYSFNGAKRQTHGGNIKVEVGAELGIFQQMVDLEKSKSYPALIKLCEQQTKKIPDWFTPYFFLGVAQANIGLKDEAIKNIQYSVDNTLGDPEYAKAREILERLKQQP